MIDLTKRNSKDTIVTGTGIVSERFATDGTFRSGYFSSAATPDSSGLVRRMWISTKPGGPPLKRFYQVKGEQRNAADVTEVEPKLSWKQGESTMKSQCKLAQKKTFYLNHQQLPFTTKPTAKSSLIRGVSVRVQP